MTDFSDDEQKLLALTQNTITFLDEAQHLCTLIGEKTDEKDLKAIASITGSRFGRYRDEIISLGPNSELPKIPPMFVRAVAYGAENTSRGPSVHKNGSRVESTITPEFTLFTWLSPTDDSVVSWNVPNKRPIEYEHGLFEWLEGLGTKPGCLVICSGIGLGEYSEHVANCLLHKFKLPLFALVRNEAYIGISSCREHAFVGVEHCPGVKWRIEMAHIVDF